MAKLLTLLPIVKLIPNTLAFAQKKWELPTCLGAFTGSAVIKFFCNDIVRQYFGWGVMIIITVPAAVKVYWEWQDRRAAKKAKQEGK